MKLASKVGVFALVAIALGGCAEVILDSNLIEEQGADVLNFAQADVSRAATPSAAADVPIRMSPVPGLQGAVIEVLGQVGLSTMEHVPAERYDVAWVGVRTTAHPDPTRITLLDAAGERALRIDFERQGLSVVTGTITGLAPIPYSNTVPHQIDVTVRPGEAEGVDVKITQAGEVLFERTGLEILDGDFGLLDAVLFDSPLTAGPYYAQDVLVEARG